MYSIILLKGGGSFNKLFYKEIFSENRPKMSLFSNTDVTIFKDLQFP